MCVGKGWFERHWEGAVKGALLAFGPLMVVCNLAAQQVPFNAIFLISDPMQKWRLLANFVLYFLPFLAGALYLGVVFLKAQKTFNRVYFADLVGSGLCGLSVLLAMYFFKPDDLIMAPLLLWLAGGVLWFVAHERPARHRRHRGRRRAVGGRALRGAAGCSASPSSRCRTTRACPTPASSPTTSAPTSAPRRSATWRSIPAPTCISRRASRTTPPSIVQSMPSNAYLGLYIDSEGPSGIIKDLPADETPYFRYLPMFYPYVLKKDPETFVVQFGGGISTAVALKSGSSHVTVAEGNPAVLTAFREDKGLRAFTNDVLHNPKVTVIDYDGRLYVAGTKNRYDIIDLSLADSAGLSSPGGFSIVEKYSYTREAMSAYMRALKPGGILSVTMWNKEEPPKSVLKLYATMAAAARDVDGGKDIAEQILRRLVLSLDRDGALQARRLHARRKSPSSTPTPRRCRSTRSTTPGFKVDTSDLRADPVRTIATSSSSRASTPIRRRRRRRSPTTSRRPARPVATPSQGRRAAGAARAGDRAGPARLALSGQRRLARRWPTTTSSTPAS